MRSISNGNSETIFSSRNVALGWTAGVQDQYSVRALVGLNQSTVVETVAI